MATSAAFAFASATRPVPLPVPGLSPQHESAPPAATAQLRSSPMASLVAPVIPATAVGVGRSCPKQLTVPPAVMTHVWSVLPPTSTMP